MAICTDPFSFTVMSTLTEIQAAIERLSPAERVKLHSLVWPDEGRWSDTPPEVRDNLAEAARGNFTEGNRANASKILDTLE